MGKRFPSGDLVERKPTEDPTIMALSQPHRRGLPERQGFDYRLESHIGRLEFIGALWGGEVKAARDYRETVLSWRKVVESRNPGEKPRSGNGGQIPDDVAEDFTIAFHKAQAVLTRLGAGVALVVYNTVVDDAPLPQNGFSSLRRGLSALSEHFRLTAVRKSDLGN